MDMPIAVAHELAEGLEEALQPRANHFECVKKALLLYVNAKWVQHVSNLSVMPQLKEIGVGARSVNSAWAVVCKALRGLGEMPDAEAQAVATHLINGLTCLPRVADLARLTAAAAAFKFLKHHASAIVKATDLRRCLLWLQVRRGRGSLCQPSQMPMLFRITLRTKTTTKNWAVMWSPMQKCQVQTQHLHGWSAHLSCFSGARSQLQWLLCRCAAQPTCGETINAQDFDLLLDMQGERGLSADRVLYLQDELGL